MLPLSYALRNLLRTPSRLLQMLIGSALVVGLFCFAAAFQRGMDRGLAATGDPRNVLVLGAGSEESVERSEISAAVPGIVAASIDGLAEDLGRPAVSPEVLYQGLVALPGHGERQAILRGVEPAALQVHRSVRLVEGDWPGPDEMLVGVGAGSALGVPDELLRPGAELRFEEHDYRISGRFAAPGTVYEGEFWCPTTELMTAVQRDSLSNVTLRLGEAEYADIAYFCSSRLDLELVAIRETDYYAKLSAFFGPIKLMAWLTALLIAAGAVFGGLNTLYAAFAARMAEFATLQAIGFRRWMVALSLIQESLAAALLGTGLALLLALLWIDGVAFRFSSGLFSLQVDGAVLIWGLGAGLALGLLGCLPPIWRCLAPPLPATLRGVA